MAIHPLAGKPAPEEMLVDVAKLEREYHERKPDMANPTQRVDFGTSGHRGTSFNGTFTEAHILDGRHLQGLRGELQGCGPPGCYRRGSATDRERRPGTNKLNNQTQEGPR